MGEEEKETKEEKTLTEIQLKALIRIQAFVKGRIANKKYKRWSKDHKGENPENDPDVEKKNIKRLKERMNLVKEFVMTERKYVENLGGVMNLYYEPLKKVANEKVKKKRFITKGDINELFGQLQYILRLNEALLETLEKEYVKWPYCDMVHVITTMGPFLKIYTPYVNKYDTLIQLLKRLSENKYCKEFLKKQKHHPDGNGLELQSYLIMPVQRIPRYLLLMKGLLKNTPTTNSEYSKIEACVKILNDVAHHVNSMKREGDLSGLIGKFARWNNLVKSHRHLVCNNENIGIECLEAIGVKGTFDVTLFDDVIVFENPNRPEFLGNLYLAFCNVTKGDAKTFHVEYYGRTFRFSFPKIQLKTKWHNLVDSCIEKTHAKCESKGITEPTKLPFIREQLVKQVIAREKELVTTQKIIKTHTTKLSNLERQLIIAKKRAQSESKTPDDDNKRSYAAKLEELNIQRLSQLQLQRDGVREKIKQHSKFAADFARNMESAQKKLKLCQLQITEAMQDERFFEMFPHPRSPKIIKRRRLSLSLSARKSFNAATVGIEHQSKKLEKRFQEIISFEPDRDTDVATYVSFIEANLPSETTEKSFRFDAIDLNSPTTSRAPATEEIPSKLKNLTSDGFKKSMNKRYSAPGVIKPLEFQDPTMKGSSTSTQKERASAPAEVHYKEENQNDEHILQLT